MENETVLSCFLGSTDTCFFATIDSKRKAIHGISVDLESHNRLFLSSKHFGPL